MTLEFEGVFFVSWLIRLVIFQQISYSKFKLPYLFLIPALLTLIEYYYYDVVFWGEILFLPSITFFLKSRERWNWLQYIFYCFFTLTIFDMLSSLSSIYFQFLFRVSEEVLDKNIWMDWIPILLTFPVYIIFFKIFRINIELLSQEVRNNKFSMVVKIFSITMIIYYLLSYILSSIPTLEYAGLFPIQIDDIYYKRIVIFSYVPIFLGFLFYIQHIIKENINIEIQKMKDSQIDSISKYSNHIESLYKEVRSFRHDYTNILVSLNESIKKRDIDEVERIYNAVLKESDKSFYNSQYDIAKLVHLKNLAMKSVVSAKLIEAQNRGIDVSVEIAEPIGTSQIDLVDFITILSVFLDNAIEAAVNAEAPRISFTYFQENENKILVIYNTTADYKIHTKNIFQYGVSTKGEGRGIGLSNVKQILSKYPKVTLETKSLDHEFTHELKMYEG